MKRWIPLLLLALGWTLSANAETLTIGQKNQATFDTTTGLLTSLTFQGETVTVEQPYMMFDILQGEKESADSRWIAWKNSEFVTLKKRDENRIVSVWKTGDWQVELQYEMDETWDMLGRSARIVWQGKEETKIKHFWWRFPIFQAQKDSYFFIPGTYPPQKYSLGEKPLKKSASWQFPPIYQWKKNASLMFCVDYLTPNSDLGGTELQQTEQGLQVSQAFAIAARMKPGDVQELGTSWLWFLPCDGESAMKKIHTWNRRFGVTVPEGRPTAFQTSILYCMHPGGTIGSNCKDLGGFTPALRWADRLAELGTNAVWFMPLEDRGIYWPRDYYRFQEGLGTGEEYRKLVQKLHDYGMYVMQDSVPHGGSNEFERAKQHPEWLVYDEDGSTFHYWCFDFNWPTWREYMKNVAKFYMTEYGVDGFRIDACGGSKIPNWNPDIPYGRASFAKLQAGLNMQRSIREGVKEVQPKTGGVLAEVNDNLFGAISDAIYDFTGGGWVFHELRKLPPETFVSQIRRWLHETKYASVEDLIRMRYIESHDTLRSLPFYGVEPARALVAMICFIDGMPMIYQEQELGNLEVYRKIFSIRHQLPELQGGDADYTSVQVPDGVFAALRTKEENRSVVLVNFHPTPVDFTLELPVTECTDMMTGKVLSVREGKQQISLPPYGYTVLALRKLAVRMPEPLRSAWAQTASPGREIPESDNVLKLQGDHYQAFIDKQTGLLLSMKRGDVEILGAAQLELPAALLEKDAKVTFEQKGDKHSFKKMFEKRELTVTYHARPDKLVVHASWAGKEVPTEAAMLFPCSQADIWSANTVEGFLKDRVIYRNEKTDVQSRHGIYWRPLPLHTLYDSCVIPIGNGFLTAEGKEAVTFQFREELEYLPARVQWLNRAGEKEGLTAAISWQNPLKNKKTDWSVEIYPEKREPKPFCCEKGGKLIPCAGGWLFENDFYQLRLSRTGTITSLISKKDGKRREICRNAHLYTDYGFGPNKKQYSSENEVEVYVDLWAVGDSVVLQMAGRPRQRGRFDRIPHPVEFQVSYSFNKTDTFTTRIQTEVPQFPAQSAFLAWMMPMKEIDAFTFFSHGKIIASGNPHQITGRSWESRKNGLLPDQLDFQKSDETLLRISNWTFDQPWNVFLDGSNFFIALYDGKIEPRQPKTYSVQFRCQVDP
ncbi:MAG: alpha-amylase family glycosyl hydrolase [Planctomycetia bacterium]|nr:alpha-amylase family glycosyl hydrolase [Planctomycetia bacterium]